MNSDDDFFGSTVLPSPVTVGVPHTDWRPNQKSALLNVLDTASNSKTKNTSIFLELPTGSGKSAIPTALSGLGNKVVVFVHTLSLLDQYRDKYGFDIVKGMANYSCVYEPFKTEFFHKRKYYPSVSDCAFDPMDACPVFQACPYIVDRTKAYASDKMACTYQFALLSPNVLRRPGIAVWDEAHFSVDTIIRQTEIKFDDTTRKDWWFLPFPFFGYQDGASPQVKSKLKDWTSNALKTLNTNKPRDLFLEELSSWNSIYKRMTNFLNFIETTPEFYFESGSEKKTIRVSRMTLEKSIPYIMVKPFSAARYANRISAYKLNILMSGTLGKPDPLAKDLGMQSYAYWEYPHPVPPNLRPVYDLGISRMTWGETNNNPVLFKIQAQKIVSFIKELPKSWRGLIVAQSYDRVNKLTDRLKELIPDRIFNFRTTDPVSEFINDTRPGMIAIGVIQVWGFGLDLSRDIARFSIVAGVPFGSQSDPYERARSKHGNPDYSWWLNYISVPQAIGRVARGETDEKGNYLLNIGALADGSSTTSSAMRFYPSWFKNALVKWEPA